MKITIKRKTDQWNADDFISGPRTFTVAGVKEGSAEQQYDIQLVESPGKCWRPPTTVLSLLVACWGDEAETWKGRRVTLYCDKTVSFGSEQTGGVRVSHMSHIDGPQSVKVQTKRARRSTITVQPLNDAPATPTITPEQWARIEALAGQLNIENVPAWVGDKLGRTLQGPQEITADEAGKLTAELEELNNTKENA